MEERFSVLSCLELWIWNLECKLKDHSKVSWRNMMEGVRTKIFFCKIPKIHQVEDNSVNYQRIKDLHEGHLQNLFWGIGLRVMYQNLGFVYAWTVGHRTKDSDEFDTWIKRYGHSCEADEKACMWTRLDIGIRPNLKGIDIFCYSERIGVARSVKDS